MTQEFGAFSGSCPPGQAASRPDASRCDPGREEPIRCDGCGRFIGYADIESGAARNEFIPLNEFGPEESSWLCPRCITKGL